eukprot:c23366_g1_i1 orf=740-1963(+)
MGDIQYSLMADLQSNSPYVIGEHCQLRSYHSATAVGDRIFLFGGVRDGRLLNDVHIFDTATGKWVSPKILGTPPAPRCGHSSSLLAKDRILILGGNTDTHDSVWILEVDTPYVRSQRQIIGMEVVAWSKGVVANTPRPVVICGPSGVGKGTLICKLMRDFPNSFGFSVSHTTRLPREKEKDGVHYHFTKRNVMEMEVQEGKFLESANVHGNLYGTSITAVEAIADAGKKCILDIDVQGAKSVKSSSLDALFIFIVPPSFEELERRLRGRGTETEEQIQKRLRNAKMELAEGSDTSLFDHILVNNDLEKCYAELKKLLCDPMQNGPKQPSLPELMSRSGHSALVIDGKVYICGGTTSVGQAMNASILVLDASKLIGGAPGRTQGFRCFEMEPMPDSGWFEDKSTALFN